MYINANKKNIFAYTGAREHQSEQESVVFVHGTGMDHTVWVLPARFFARHQYNVLATDLPGHGRSEGPPLDTIEKMADEVVAAMKRDGRRQGRAHPAAVEGPAVDHNAGRRQALAVGRRLDLLDPLSQA